MINVFQRFSLERKFNVIFIKRDHFHKKTKKIHTHMHTLAVQSFARTYKTYWYFSNYKKKKKALKLAKA